MRNRVLASLLTVLAVAPAVLHAQQSTGPGGVPPPPHRPVPVDPPVAWVPRPNGWQWGGPGWWRGAYRPPVPGYVLPSIWLDPVYVVEDWDRYGFPEPRRGQRWVRYYDDAVLIDDRGVIHDSVPDVAWGRYDRGPVPAYAGDAPDDGPAYGAPYDEGDDEVTWDGGRARSGHEIWAWPDRTIVRMTPVPGPVIMLRPGESRTIVVPCQQVVTITTETYYERVAPGPDLRPRTKIVPRTKARPREDDKAPRVIGRVPVS